jgi:hypothetical protein
MGIREDVPSITITQAFTTDNENVVLRYGEIHRALMRSEQCLSSGSGVQTPDTHPVLTYHYFEQADGTDYLLAFTKAHIYHWDTVGSEWDLKFTCNSDCTAWSVVTFADKCYATNNIDKIQVWNGTWSTFRNLEASKYSTGTVDAVIDDATLTGTDTLWDTDNNIADGDIIYLTGDDHAYEVDTITDDTHLEMTAVFDGDANISGGTYAIYDDIGVTVGSSDYLTKAKFIVDFETYLMAGNVTVSGTTYPQMLYWCDTFDPDTWDTGNADSVILPGPEPLQGTGKVDDFLLVFSGRSIDQVWATDSSLVFNTRRLRNRLGTYSPDSIVNGVNGELYFVDAQKNIRVCQSAMSDFAVISEGMDKSLKLMPDSLLSGIRADYISELEQKWWAIPYGPSATANNRVICLDKYGAWTRRDLSVSAFGQFEEKSTYTWENIDTMFDTWADAGWPWDTVAANADYRLDICGDSSGNTYNSHNADLNAGYSYTGYAVIATDFSTQKGGPALDIYKRLTGITTIFRDEGTGTATLSIKRDAEGSWQNLGSVNLYGSGGDFVWTRTNCDVRARHYSLKISATNMFRFVGCIFYYMPEGLN